MSKADQPFMDHLKDVVDRAGNLLNIARDSELQRQALRELEELSLRAAGLKQAVVRDRSDEEDANGLLAWESVFTALTHELTMWLKLKSEEPEDAWNSLVRAQTALMDAMRAHSSFDHLRSELARLESVEAIVFPSQIFMSAGMIVRRSLCSVCKANYDACDHIVGRPYWGELCRRLLVEVEGNHVALVKHPANKHCRVTHFSEAGGKRNRMTWRLDPYPDGQAAPEPGPLHTEGIILSSDGTDVVAFGDDA